LWHNQFMINKVYIKDLPSHIGEKVSVAGFVNTIRNQGGIKFLLLRDSTGFVQCIVMKSNTQAFETIADIHLESVVLISGILKEERQAPSGFEVLIEEIEVLSESAPELPIPVNQDKIIDEVEMSKRFDHRWLDLRNPDKLKFFQAWTYLEEGFRKVFLENGFIQIYTPSFMSTASESGAEVFEVKYFDKKAYLAQSPQFYKQMAMASGFDRVFISTPVFRAEPSYTTRHMTEFTGWDFEMSFIDSHHDLMDLEEKLIISGFQQLNNKLNLDLKIPTSPFPRVSMEEAKKILNSLGVPSEKAGDLSSHEEVELGKYISEKYDSDFVFIIDYPITVRPFYHMRHQDNPKLTKSADLLYKGLEITTLAQREHRISVLEKQAQEKGMDLNELKDYLDFFRYGCPPHGGGGIGPARIIKQIFNLASVKEATYLPRDVKRLNP